MTAKPKVLQQYVTAICATIGALGIGLILGFASPAGVLLTDPTKNSTITITEYENSWFSSTSNLGALIGCPLAGISVNYFGRRGTIIYSAIPALIGWILIVAAQNFPMLVIGRIISGTYCSFICISAPTYIGEYASANIRGALGSFFQLMVNVGILVAYCYGAIFDDFRWIAGMCAIFPLICSAFMFFKTESPMYLLSKGKEEEAEKSLRYFRGKDYEGLTSEIQVMKDSIAISQKKRATLADFKQPHLLKPFLISMSLFFHQQFCGATAVLFNLSSIFKGAGSDLSANASSIIIGVVQVVVVLISAGLVDKAGRKLLLVISALFMALSHVALGTFFYLKTHNPTVAENISWLPLVSLIVFISAFCIGFGPIPWVILGELFSPEVKELSSSLVSMSNWTFAFIVTLLFQPLMEIINDYGVYWMFAGFCVLNLITVILFVYETKGKTLQQINEHFGGPKISPEEINMPDT